MVGLSCCPTTTPPGAGPAWTGEWYVDPVGSISEIHLPSLNLAASWTSIAGGNYSPSTKVAVRTRPIFKTFIPIQIFTGSFKISDYIKELQAGTPLTLATTNFFALQYATLAKFTEQLSKQVDAIGFLGHSLLDPISKTSIGLGFAGNGGSLNWTIPTSFVDKLSPPNSGDTFTTVDTFSTNAKVVFIGACDVGSTFESLWAIQSGTKGQALIVPDLSKFSGAVNLAHAAVAWLTIINQLANGSTVQAAVDQGNVSVQTQPAGVERWMVIGDGSVTIAKKPSN